MRQALALTIATLLANAAWADDGDGRYEIRSGNLSGLPSTAPNPTPPVTMLIDHQTGRTWFLAVIDGEVRWQALPFGRAASADTVPPMLDAGPSDGDTRGEDGISKR